MSKVFAAALAVLLLVLNPQMAWASGGVVPSAGPVLGSVPVEQTWTIALARVGRYQMPCALHLRGNVDPACFEAEGAKFSRVDLTHGAYAGEVFGGALHVHRLRQQFERRVGAPIDGS